jgi:hypothetical protein
VNLFPLILSLLMSLASQIALVGAADAPRRGLGPPDEMRAKQQAPRSEGTAKKAAAEREALYQFMTAEDRVGITVVDQAPASPAPR